MTVCSDKDETLLRIKNEYFRFIVSVVELLCGLRFEPVACSTEETLLFQDFLVILKRKLLTRLSIRDKLGINILTIENGNHTVAKHSTVLSSFINVEPRWSSGSIPVWMSY